MKTLEDIEEIACNPVGKVRIIVDTMTTDISRANEIMGVICHELTGEEIDEFYNKLEIDGKQLKLKL